MKVIPWLAMALAVAFSGCEKEEDAEPGKEAFEILKTVAKERQTALESKKPGNGLSLGDSVQEAFTLKTDGKETTFAEVCEKLEKHFKRKVRCETPRDPDAYLGGFLVPLDIKKGSFWTAICEVSKQSGFGFKPFFDGVLFSSDAFAVMAYKDVCGCPVIVRELLCSNAEGSKHFLRLDILRVAGMFGKLEFLDERVVRNQKIEKLKCAGYSSGNDMKREYSLPQSTLFKDVDLAFRIKGSRVVNREEFSLEARKDVENEIGGTRILITSFEKEKEKGVIKFSVTWDYGVSPEETKRFQEMNDKMRSGKWTKIDHEWIERVAGRKGVKPLTLHSIDVVNEDGESAKSKSWTALGGLGIGLDCTCEFEMTGTPKTVIISLSEEKPFEQELLFEELDFSAK